MFDIKEIASRLETEGLDQETALVVANKLASSPLIEDSVKNWLKTGKLPKSPRIHGYSPNELATTLHTRREAFAALLMLYGDAEGAMTLLGYGATEPTPEQITLVEKQLLRRDPYLTEGEAHHFAAILGAGDKDIWRAAYFWATQGEMTDFPDVYGYTPVSLERLFRRPVLVFQTLAGLRSRRGRTEAQMALHELIQIDNSIQPNREVYEDPHGQSR